MTSFLFRGEVSSPGSWRLWKGGLSDIMGALFFVSVSSHSLEDVYTVDIAILTILYVH